MAPFALLFSWLQSFADLIDGAFSEYEGQSEYDPVVPGGTSMTDGIVSDTGSSR